MKVIATAGREDIAVVYIAELGEGRPIECVEAVQPPLRRDQKWVLLISTMSGCPLRCQMCDAGGYYRGKLSREEIFAQIDFLVRKRFPDGVVPAAQFKIQFARMGEPTLNDSVLDVLDELPQRYRAAGLMPSLSTVAPLGADRFLARLADIKRAKYAGGRFQFQFSIHTTDERLRDELMPARKWDFARMAEYGEQYYSEGDRKITLNFALAQGMPVDPQTLLRHFDPARFLVKITPLNPTYRAAQHRLSAHIDPVRAEASDEVVRRLQAAGYQVIVSMGEAEESYIGSNCGQYVVRHLAADDRLASGYTYAVRGYEEEHAEPVA